MANEVVKYHNDLNNISLGGLSENQINILFTLFAKVENKSTEILKFPINQIIELSGISTTNKDYLEATIFSQFDKLQNLKIRYNDDDGTAQEVIFPRVHIDKKREFLSVRVSEAFAYIFNNLMSNFTRFELAEFVNLSGKYTKTIYRLLKQYRSTGVFKIEFERFKEILDIPKSYETRDIEKQILKPAIKELSSERSLFDQIRTPFKNLTYEKGKTKGKGNKITHLIFTFDPENTDNKKIKAEKKEIQKRKIENEKTEFSNQFYGKKISTNGTTFLIYKIYKNSDGTITADLENFSKLSYGKTEPYNFKNLETLKKLIAEYEKNNPVKDRPGVRKFFKS